MRPGDVPTAAVGPIIAGLVHDRWPHGGGITVLAEKVGCDDSAIEGLINREREGVSFDLADRLLCALGRPDIWRGLLADVYLTVELPEPEVIEFTPSEKPYPCGHERTRENSVSTGFAESGKRYFRCRECLNEKRRARRRLLVAA